MKKALFLVPLLLSTLVYAGTNDDAFNAGASFGKGNAAQGTGSLKNPGTVTGDIPGYTANPPQSGYYNGPDGGDGGLLRPGLLPAVDRAETDARGDRLCDLERTGRRADLGDRDGGVSPAAGPAGDRGPDDDRRRGGGDQPLLQDGRSLSVGR